jgi:phosphomannomutase/phosphoglucomutase
MENFPNHHPDPSDEQTLEDIKKELAKWMSLILVLLMMEMQIELLLSKKYNYQR